MPPPELGEGWGVTPSEGSPLEAGLRARLDELSKEQQQWAAACAEASARLGAAQSLLAAVELLRSGVSVAGDGVAAEMVERLVRLPAWEAREQQLLAEQYEQARCLPPLPCASSSSASAQAPLLTTPRLHALPLLTAPRLHALPLLTTPRLTGLAAAHHPPPYAPCRRTS